MEKKTFIGSSIEAHIAQFDHSLKKIGRTTAPWGGRDRKVNHWVFTLSGIDFDYYTGMGVTQDPTPADIMTCLLGEARIGADDLDAAIAYCYNELGYEGKEGIRVARACVDVYEKLDLIGAYDANLAEMV